MTIYLGSDHRGYQLKLKIKDEKLKLGIGELVDLGVFEDKKSADYPLIAEKVAQAVAKNPDSLGILICASGQGVCIAANKIKGIRAAQAWSPKVAEAGRKDDQINILCLSADQVDEKTNLRIVKSFLTTHPLLKKRYLRRIKEIKQLEDEN
jgi:ribose 5-phosphate isomerase B